MIFSVLDFQRLAIGVSTGQARSRTVVRRGSPQSARKPVAPIPLHFWEAGEQVAAKAHASLSFPG